jgi:glycosyltransferase involved in cell wall biosynthesis
MGVAASRVMSGAPVACRPVRVLVAVGPAVGGMARHVSGLLRGLDPNRFDVSLAGPPDDPAAAAARSRPCAVYPMRFGSSPRSMAGAALRLAGLVRRRRKDIVHAHGYSACAAAAMARRLAPQARLVCTLHSFLTGTDARAITGWRTRRLLRLIARRADRIITVSDSLHQQFAGIAEAQAKLVTIANGIDLSAFEQADPASARRELGLPESGPVVGMVGRLAAQKGPLDFVRAAAVAHAKLPDACFVLIGDGPLRGEVVKLAGELGISDSLVLAGHRPEAPMLTAAFDVAVIASVSEGSSLTAMEAMAWSKPVAGTAVGGVREVVADGETGILVPAGDRQALGDAITSLLRDPERARTMGEAGRQRVEREFSLARMMEKTEEVYLAVAHSSSRGEGHK